MRRFGYAARSSRKSGSSPPSTRPSESAARWPPSRSWPTRASSSGAPAAAGRTMRSVSPRFIACHRSLSDARIVLYGIPFEGRVNLRKGADSGPRDLRLASDSIETYSPFLDRDMEDLPLADIGDCELPDGAPPREQLDAARDEIRAWWRHGLAGAGRATGARADRRRPAAERLPGDRWRPGRGRARLGPDGAHRHRRLLGDPRGAPDVVGNRAVSREREYTAPRYYEIAFDMNRKGEVDFLVHCFKRYAKRPVRRVLDIACGTGPHLARLAERDFEMVGLDLSRSNIEFLRERLAAKGQQAELVVGDMTDFRLAKPVDAALCMQDSQGHLLTNEQLVAHLKTVARAVRPGGLYVFDRYMVSSWTDPARAWSWSRRRGRVIVRASFSALHDVNPVTQVFRERMVLEGIENGRRRVYRQSHLSRMLFPQEVKALVALAGGFEFVQWFFGFKPHQVLEKSRHPLLMVVVLRRTR